MINSTQHDNDMLLEKIEALHEIIRIHDSCPLDLRTEQSKLESKVEMCANYISGFLLAWLVWTLLVVGPFTWGWLVKENGFAITMVFTFVSLIRSYYWRRFFARGFHRIVTAFIKRVLKW